MNSLHFWNAMLQKEKTAIFIILLIHFAGLPFIAYPPTRPFFLLATPITLSLSFVLVLWNHSDWSKSFIAFCLLTLNIGFGAEVIGIQTGILFGNYFYGTILGPQLGGVPFIIGTNWLICIYACGVLSHQVLPPTLSNKNRHTYPPPIRTFFRILLGASLMLLLDVAIEPVAVTMDFWQWENSQIPTWNYTTWFLLSCFLLVIFELLSFDKNNKVAIIMYFTLLSFFGILNFACPPTSSF